MKHPYELGSIWMRRDGKRAVVVSDDHADFVNVVVVNDKVPYVVFSTTGRCHYNDVQSPSDLIYRDEDELAETAPDDRAVIDP